MRMHSHHMPTTPEKYWDDAVDGESFVSPSYTVTVPRINAHADLTFTTFSIASPAIFYCAGVRFSI